MKLSDYLWDKKILILLYLATSLFTGGVIYMSESTSLIESYGLYTIFVKLYKDANKKIIEYNTKSIENIEFMTTWIHEIKTPIAAAKLIIENSLNDPSEKALYSIEDEINKIEDFAQMTLFYSRSNDFEKDYLICTSKEYYKNMC